MKNGEGGRCVCVCGGGGVNHQFYSYKFYFRSLTTKQQMSKFSSVKFQKNVKSKLCQTENSKTRGQTVQI